MRFCLRASSHDLDRLEASQERFIKEADQEPLDFYRLDGCNREFHKIIVENEPNSEALQVIERHGDIINAARSRLALTRGRSLTRIKEHGAIIAALRIADADAAVADRKSTRLNSSH